MDIGISNLSWSPEEDIEIIPIMKRYNVTNIDIVPFKYFPDATSVTKSEAEQLTNKWRRHGISINGMQSLFFGTHGLNLFCDSATQIRMLNHIEHICRIAELLNVRPLVFGSPKARDKLNLSDEIAKEVAVEFFRKAGAIAERHNVDICLEPNPIIYSANFMTNSKDTAYIVNEVANNSIKMTLDTGAIQINGENPGEVIPKFSKLYGHIHLSEPNLAALGSTETNHVTIKKLLDQHIDGLKPTIEMKASPNSNKFIEIENAIRYTVRIYSPETRSNI